MAEPPIRPYLPSSGTVDTPAAAAIPATSAEIKRFIDESPLSRRAYSTVGKAQATAECPIWQLPGRAGTNQPH